MLSNVARNPGTIAAGRASQQALVLLLIGTALFLAVENAVLLFTLGPVIEWPASLQGLGVCLSVVRILFEAFAPGIALGAAALVAGAAAMWAVLRFSKEVNHA